MCTNSGALLGYELAGISKTTHFWCKCSSEQFTNEFIHIRFDKWGPLSRLSVKVTITKAFAGCLIFMFINSLFSLGEKKAEEQRNSITFITRWMRENGMKEGDSPANLLSKRRTEDFIFPDYRQPRCSTDHLMLITLFFFLWSLIWSDNVMIEESLC